MPNNSIIIESSVLTIFYLAVVFAARNPWPLNDTPT